MRWLHVLPDCPCAMFWRRTCRPLCEPYSPEIAMIALWKACLGTAPLGDSGFSNWTTKTKLSAEGDNWFKMWVFISPALLFLLVVIACCKFDLMFLKRQGEQNGNRQSRLGRSSVKGRETQSGRQWQGHLPSLLTVVIKDTGACEVKKGPKSSMRKGRAERQDGRFKNQKGAQCRPDVSGGEKEDSQIPPGPLHPHPDFALWLCTYLSICWSVYLSVVQIPDSKSPGPSKCLYRTSTQWPLAEWTWNKGPGFQGSGYRCNGGGGWQRDLQSWGQGSANWGETRFRGNYKT